MNPTASSVRDELRSLAPLPDDAVDPAETALLLAGLERPAKSRQSYRDFLARLGDEVAAAAVGDLAGRAGALAAVIAGRHRFAGDDRDYDELDNANLMRVIDRRRGLPVTLGILYLHAGRRAGWRMQGLAFPAHFLVRLEDASGSRLILDPFDRGAVLGPAELRALLKSIAGNEAELSPGHYAPVSDRAVLVRLQNNIKLRLLRGGQIAEALRCVETTLLFAPDEVALWREAGMMHARLGDLPAAIAALEQFVARAPNSPARHRACAMVQELRGRLH